MIALKHRLIIGITGASGSIYAKVLFDRLIQYQAQIDSCGVIFSPNALDVWKHELGDNSYELLPFRVYQSHDFHAPFASGSAGYNSMIICPCSMGTLGRIASGVSDNLMIRAADVILKERQKLVLVIRETPYNLIHINNMKTVTEAGGIICPATPSFYSLPASFEELAATVVDRALALAGFQIEGYRWGL